MFGSVKDMHLHILAKVFVLSAESVWTQPVRKTLAQTSALVTPHHTVVKTSVLIAENVPTKLVQKPFAQTSAHADKLFTTTVKTGAKLAESAQTKTVLKQFAQINAKVTFHHMLVKTCANNVANAPTRIAQRPFAPTNAMDTKKLAKSNCN